MSNGQFGQPNLQLPVFSGQVDFAFVVFDTIKKRSERKGLVERDREIDRERVRKKS